MDHFVWVNACQVELESKKCSFQNIHVGLIRMSFVDCLKNFVQQNWFFCDCRRPSFSIICHKIVDRLQKNPSTKKNKSWKGLKRLETVNGFCEVEFLRLLLHNFKILFVKLESSENRLSGEQLNIYFLFLWFGITVKKQRIFTIFVILEEFYYTSVLKFEELSDAFMYLF